MVMDTYFSAAGKLLSENPQKYEIINQGISGNRIVELYIRIKRTLMTCVILCSIDNGEAVENAYKVDSLKEVIDPFTDCERYVT